MHRIISVGVVITYKPSIEVLWHMGQIHMQADRSLAIGDYAALANIEMDDKFNNKRNSISTVVILL